MTMSDPNYNATPPGGYALDMNDVFRMQLDMIKCEACGAIVDKEAADRMTNGDWLCSTCANAVDDMNEGRI
jgi:ribosomal protein L37AE/L43A